MGRRRTLSGGLVPVVGTMGRVERKVPRQHAPVLEERRRGARRCQGAHHRLARPLRIAGTRHQGQRQLHHRARRIHHDGPRVVQQQAQRSQWRGQPRRREPQQQLELRLRGPDRRPRRQPTATPAGEERRHHAHGKPGHTDGALGRRDRKLAAGQQQRLLPGQRDSMARLERPGEERRHLPLLQAHHPTPTSRGTASRHGTPKPATTTSP